MSLVEKLLKVKYPIRDIETNQIIGYKEITNASLLENAAGVVISIDGNESNIILPFSEAFKLVESVDEDSN